MKARRLFALIRTRDRSRSWLTFFLLIAVALPMWAQAPQAGAPTQLIGLIESAQVIRDTYGIAHIRAGNDHDLLFLQGYTHAQDRLFQMDYFRRAGSGTLAELFGNAALPQDVQARTVGFRRAAQRSLPLQSPRMQLMLQAYADGVNAYAATHPLPPEYGALGILQFEPWQPLDTLTVMKLLSWNTNFNNSDLAYTTTLLTYQGVGLVAGFDGTKLYFEDLYRAEPFDHSVTLLDAFGQAAPAAAKAHHAVAAKPDAAALDLIKGYQQKIKGLAFFDRAGKEDGGSNGWAVSGRFTESGAPLMANDPHLTLTTPSIWYPIHLSAGTIDVIGQSFAGTPLVVHGHNRWIAWGSTATYADIIDYYREQVVPSGSSPSGLSTMYMGAPEPIIPVPETFRSRVNGQLVTVPPGGSIPAATLIVPRRNRGPILSLNTATGAGISMQWTGFAGTKETDAILAWAEARTPADFERGIRLFGGSTQNFFYADRKGNFGYYMSGELPIREDLQAGSVVGLPPAFLRSGQGYNEWMPLTHPQPDQSLPYEILPYSEMPHALNPPAGFVVNANNDPIGVSLGNEPLGTLRPGGGIYYISAGFAPGQRSGQITELIQEKMKKGKLTVADMQQIQASTVLHDAEYFVPFVTRALENGKRQGAPALLAALAADPAVVEAVGRLAAWDFTTPTGIPEGYDAFEPVGQHDQPSPAQIASSVAATLYQMWRSEFVRVVIDSKVASFGMPTTDAMHTLNALRHMLDTLDVNQGIGASGIPFLAVPGISNPPDARDILILQSVRNALQTLAGPAFANTLHGSTNQDDYRWGKLHRLTLAHVMGGPFSTPPAGGAFPPPLAGLGGIPVDGAWGTVDAASNALVVTNENGYTWTDGVSQRSVAEALPNGVRGVSSLPGGVSGVLGSPFYTNLLPAYLVNSYYDQLFGMNELQGGMETVNKYEP